MFNFDFFSGCHGSACRRLRHAAPQRDAMPAQHTVERDP
jgi:hypothetical protein